MAKSLDRYKGFPGVAASVIRPRTAVAFASGLDWGVRPVGTYQDAPFGVTGDATAALGAGINVYDRGAVVKVTAAASIGRGAQVVYEAASVAFGPGAGAGASVINSVGQSLTPAAAGETFSLYVNPTQLSGV